MRIARRNLRTWIGLSFALAAVVLVPDSLFRGGAINVHVSSTQLGWMLGRNAMAFSAPGPLLISKALTNRNELELQGRLLVGEKVYSLVTTNASLAQLAVGFAHFARCKVIVPGEPDEADAPRLGAFDSRNYRNRRKAAKAIEKILDRFGYRIVRLKDGPVAFVADSDYEVLLTGKSRLAPPVPAQAGPASVTRPADSRTVFE
jgi:hypothetical protein